MSKVQLTGNSDSSLMLDGHTVKIVNTIDKIKSDFIYIGFLLWEVKHYGFYKSKGYSSVVEYAEKELNFKKASTYNFINVCERFSRRHDNGNPTMNIDTQYKSFNFTQLCEILPLKDSQINNISPDMTVKEIRAVKKSNEIVTEKVQLTGKTEVFENIDIAKNQVTVEDVLQEDNSSTLFDINSKDFLVSNNLYILTDRQVKILLDIQGSMLTEYLNSRKSWNDKKKDSILSEICEIRKVLEREN